MMLQNSIDYLGTSDIPLVADNNSYILVSVVFTVKLVYSTQTQTSSEHTWLSQHVLFLTPSLRPQLVFYTLVSHATMVSRPAGNFDLSVCLSLDDYDNPEVPKLEKSISGSSPSRDRLLLTVASLFFIALSVS